jgi:uncharacterized protein
MKKITLSFIKIYQKSGIFHSPFFKTVFMTDNVCRFQPTCSHYTYQAVEKYGTAKGLWLGLKRIVRCHPWSKGGLDPVK